MTPNPWSYWLLRSRSRTVRCPLRPLLWAWKVQPALSASVGTLSPSSFHIIHNMRCLASSIFQASPESYNARRHLKKGALPLEPRHVILLTGPAGAGKTATASAWAKSHRHPTVHLSIDTFREFVKSGYSNPEDGWNGETQRQYDLAQTACSEVAREYVESGYCCAIDDAVFPNWPEVGYGRWQAVLGPIQHRLIVLLPSLILSQKVCAGRIRTNVPTPGYNIQSLFRILPQHTVALRCAKSLELPQNGFLRGNQASTRCWSEIVPARVTHT